MDRPLCDVRLAAASILVGLPVAVAVVVDLVVGGGGVGWVGVLPGLLAVAAFVAPLVQQPKPCTAGPAACGHARAVPVESAVDPVDVLAWLCPDCGAQLPAGEEDR